jgi:hypothetical protein
VAVGVALLGAFAVGLAAQPSWRDRGAKKTLMMMAEWILLSLPGGKVSGCGGSPEVEAAPRTGR